MLIKIDNIDINYEVYGDGEQTLLLLHGWMASIPTMAPIWQYFKSKRKVVVLDFPGQGGKSGKLTVPWGVPEYSEMVRKFMTELKIEKPDVIGHSFGGRVAIYLASNYPELFNKIILTDSAGLKKRFSIKRWIKIRSYKLGKFFLKLFSPKELYQEKLKDLRKKYGSSDYSNLENDIMRETFKKVVNLDLKSNLRKIQNSCLLMWGENDNDTPVYMAKKMEKLIKDSGLVVLKNAGHFSYIDSSNEYNIIVEKFLES